MNKLICAVTLLAVSTAQADTIYVDADTCPGLGSGTVGDPYCSIQTAIDNAVDADEIVVAPGTYLETINFLGKAITLRSSDGPELTTIDAGGIPGVGSVVTCDSAEGPDTVLEGFTVTGGRGTSSSNGVFGGGMYNFQSSPTVTNCSFVGNVVQCISSQCTARGSGMYNFQGSPTVTNCSFVGNSLDCFGSGCTTYGGGMYSRQGSPTVTNCMLIGNVARLGGGMFNTLSSPTVTDCTFSGNSVVFGGGGMYNSQSAPTVTSCTFSDNSAGGGGGMSNNTNSSPTITQCNFSGNTATSRGGGMNNDRSSPTVMNCTFEMNTAPIGGAMNTDEVGGGGPCSANPEQGLIMSCSFDGNTATTDGGGMYIRCSSSLTVIDCSFSGNSATCRGGGTFSVFSNATITDCSFDGNSALQTGGGMHNRSSSPTVSNCAFSGNSAMNGWALAVDSVNQNFPSELIMANCVLWDGGDEIWINDGATITISFSNVQNGFPGTDNIDADPLFVDPDNGDLRLAPGSPCIDAGHNNAIADLTDTDLDGNPRFADDPATEDTGCGILAIVDMGAYEYQGVPAEVVFADLTGDGFVGVADLMILNGCVGSSDPDCCIADLDLDGEVGMSDRILAWASIAVEFSSVR